MFKDFFKKKDEQPDQKKKLENIVVFIIILIITVLIINSMWSKDDKEDESNDSNNSNKVLANVISGTESENNSKDDLEERLEDILASIDGVGKVKVLIKYSESSQVVAMYNETSSENKTEENDGDGGTKNSTETETKKEIVYTDEDGTSKPITEKVVMPVIEGAIITAQGASNANTKTAIVSAVEAVTGLAIHKIQVFEMGN